MGKKLLATLGGGIWALGYLMGANHTFPSLENKIGRAITYADSYLREKNISLKLFDNYSNISNFVDWIGNENNFNDNIYEEKTNLSYNNNTIHTFYTKEEVLEYLSKDIKDPLNGFEPILDEVFEAYVTDYMEKYEKENLTEKDLKKLKNIIKNHLKERKKSRGLLYSFPKEYPSFYPTTLPKDYNKKRKDILEKWKKLELYSRVCVEKYCKHNKCSKDYAIVLDVPFIPEVIDEYYGTEESVIPSGNRTMLIDKEIDDVYYDRNFVPMFVFDKKYEECKKAVKISRDLTKYNCRDKKNLINPTTRCIPRIENSLRKIFRKSVEKTNESYLSGEGFYPDVARKLEQNLTWEDIEKMFRGDLHG